MGKQVAQTALGDGERGRRERAAAAELGADPDRALAVRRAGRRGVAPLRLARRIRRRRPEGAQRGERAARAFRILAAPRERGGQIHERRAAGMQVADEVRARNQLVLDVPGDLLRHAAVRIAGEEAVEVAVIDGRHAPPREGSGKIGSGQQNHTAADRLRAERAREIAERELALIFVAVIAGHQQRGRPRAVAEHHDGDRDEAVGRGMRRMEQAQETLLASLPVEIDLRDDPRPPRAAHDRFPFPSIGALPYTAVRHSGCASVRPSTTAK